MEYVAIPVIKLEIFASYSYHHIILKQTYRKIGIILQITFLP